MLTAVFIHLQVCNAVKRTGDIFDFDDEGGKMKTITGATWKALRGFSVTEDISKASGQFSHSHA